MSLVEICERYNISVRYYSPDSVERFGLSLTGGGYATLIGDQLYILCDRTRPQEERRFIIAHELGHILLGHLTFREKIWTDPTRMETEANLFAAVMIANDLHSQSGKETVMEYRNGTMAYYRTCPYCGANLDPGERCDCLESMRAWAMELIAQLTPQERVELFEEVKNLHSQRHEHRGRGTKWRRRDEGQSI